jgi:hypothetical protein
MGGVDGSVGRIVLGQLVFAALVAVTWIRAPRAWRVWVAFVFCYAANVVAVGYGRAAWGAALGHNLLYAVENGWMLALATGLALCLPARSPHPVPYRYVPVVATVTVAGLAGWCVLAWSAARATVAVWPGLSVHTYVGNAQQSAARITGPFSLWDTPAPFVQPDYPQFRRQAYVLGLGFVDAAIDDPSRPGYLVQQDGHLAPATLDVAASWQATGAGVCTDGRAEARLTVPLPKRLPPTSDFLRLRTSAAAPVTAHLTVTVTGGSQPAASDESPDTRIGAGTSTTIVPLRPGPLGRLVIDVPKGSALCLLGAEVGRPVATG